ncbi:MAG TPA: hypothetical protein VFC19_07675 [Candidatus Limnocylindrales bacterium]|nr:hypothetical protein [Candidatus Limnocylindrales bacterium]
MEWLTLPALWGIPPGLLEPWSAYHYDQRLERPETGPAAAPSELDLALIEALYEAIAAATHCGRCGATLGRRLHVVPSSRSVSTPASWRLLVVTRCHGWRRHAFAADVTEVAQDLRINQFSPV